MLDPLCCRHIARLMPVEDRLGDVRGEIAEADDTSEVGRAHAFALGKRSKGNAVAVGEGRIKPARPDQQLDLLLRLWWGRIRNVHRDMPRTRIIDGCDTGMSARPVREHEIEIIPDDVPLLVGV